MGFTRRSSLPDAASRRWCPPTGTNLLEKLPVAAGFCFPPSHAKAFVMGPFGRLLISAPDLLPRPTGVLGMQRAFRRPHHRSRTPLAALRAGVVYVACPAAHAAPQRAPLFPPTILAAGRRKVVAGFDHEATTSLRSAVSARFARLVQHVCDRRRRGSLPARRAICSRAHDGLPAAPMHFEWINAANPPGLLRGRSVLPGHSEWRKGAWVPAGRSVRCGERGLRATG